MILKIIKAPNPILNRVCSEAAPPYNYFLFCEELLYTKQQTQNAIGLAAPQVGVDVRIFVCMDKVCVNPTVICFRGKRLPAHESCLSLPGRSGVVFRHTHLDVAYYTSRGQLITESMKHLEARVFQHELDHLNGILFPERVLK